MSSLRKKKGGDDNSDSWLELEKRGVSRVAKEVDDEDGVAGEAFIVG